MTDFAPIRVAGATVKITVGAASGSVQLHPEGKYTRQYRVCNLGTATAWIKFGGSTVVATTSDTPIPGSGFTEVWTTGEDYVAAIAAGATGDIVFTPVDGI